MVHPEFPSQFRSQEQQLEGSRAGIFKEQTPRNLAFLASRLAGRKTAHVFPFLLSGIFQLRRRILIHEGG